MAKSKYDAQSFPLLAEQYARDGLIDEQIAAKLGVSTGTYYEYQKKYPEFLQAIKKGKAPVDTMVENALLKRALGYDYEEIKTEALENNQSDITDDTSKPVKEVIVKRVTKTKKHIQGDVTAQIFWLKNRRPDKWADKTVQDVNQNDITEVEKAKAMFDSMTLEEKTAWLESQK